MGVRLWSHPGRSQSCGQLSNKWAKPVSRHGSIQIQRETKTWDKRAEGKAGESGPALHGQLELQEEEASKGRRVQSTWAKV